MFRRHLLGASALVAVAVILATTPARATTITFTAQDVVSTMAADGAPLDNATNQWGLCAVRVMPIVGGSGLYTITGGSTTQAGWGASNALYGAAPYSASNSAWFYDYSGAEAGYAANPLYMIMDVAAANFCSYTFDASAAAIGGWSPGGTGCSPQVFKPSGYDSGAGGTNIVTAVDPSATFSFNFTLGTGATWDGSYQFVVDGSEYGLGTAADPGTWVENFYGGYFDYGGYYYPGYYDPSIYTGGVNGGGLANNTGPGYAAIVPEPSSLALLGGFLLAGAWTWRRKLRRT